jgi:hypothetical protein
MLEVEDVEDDACTVDDMEVRGKGGTRVQDVQELLGGARLWRPRVRGMSPDYGIIWSRPCTAHGIVP